MNNKFNLDTMFDAIKSGIETPENTNKIDYSNIMKFEIGKTYRVRLLPYVADPSKTFWHYSEYGFTSKATDQYMSAISPSTWGEPCPLREQYLINFKTTGKSDIKKRDQWLINAYVIDDPTNPANNGTVKIIRYGKQLDTVIRAIIEGDLKEDVGQYAFDLSSNGYDLIIKVDKQQDYPNYSASSFARRACALPGVGDDMEKIEAIYNSAFDLSSIFPVKSYAALQKMMEEHYMVNSTITSNNTSTTSNGNIQTAVIEEQANVNNPISYSNTSASDSTDLSTVDDELDKLIQDL